MSEYLPDVDTDSREAYPESGQALDNLGADAGEAGPLDEMSQRLIKLEIAVGELAEGAVRSNTRRALELGATPEEVRPGFAPGHHYCLVSHSNRRADLDRRSTRGPRPSNRPRHGCLVHAIVYLVDRAAIQVMKAAATASQSGSLALQGAQAALGLSWWATHSDVDIELRDDTSSTSTARLAYRGWVDADVDILFGPYGSNLVRAVIPVVTGSGRLLWNHGGSADDLARPMVVPLPAPASTYLTGAVEIAAEAGVEEILLAVGRGPFATWVGSGVREKADRIGLPVRQCELASVPAVAAEATKAAVLIAASFDREVAAIAELSDTQSPLIACVAAGLPEFYERLGDAVEGVVGPVQWIPQATTPDIGPSGTEYARHY